MRRALLAATMVTVVMTAAPSHAATIQRFEIEGRQARAHFVERSGCVYSLAEIRGMDGRISTHGRTVGSQVMMVLIAYDVCTNTVLRNAIAIVPLASRQFRLDAGLTEASLDVTCDAFDFVSNTEIPVTASVRWIAAGATERVERNTVIRSANLVIREEASLIARRGRAVGSVSVGTATLFSGPAEAAEMGKVLSGTVAVQY